MQLKAITEKKIKTAKATAQYHTDENRRKYEIARRYN